MFQTAAISFSGDDGKAWPLKRRRSTAKGVGGSRKFQQVVLLLFASLILFVLFDLKTNKQKKETQPDSQNVMEH